MGKFIKIICALLFASIFYAAPSEAHSPYAIKIQDLKDPQGNLLILEKLYGDGILSEDPAKLQVRNKNGVVLARSITGTHLAVFCPSIQFCWAFPYNGGLFIEPMVLDYQKLKYNDASTPNVKAELASYLNGSEKVSRSRSFLHPMYQDKPENFLPGSPFIKILSPLIILVDSFLNFLVLAAVYFIPSFLFPSFCTYTLSKQGFTRFTLKFLTFIFVLASALFALFLSFINLFTFATPFLYGLLVAAFSIGFGLFLSNTLLAKGSEN